MPPALSIQGGFGPQWAGKRRLEIGIITLVAVALTLLGLSLTMGEGIRKFLIWPAGVIAGRCAVGFGWVFSQPVVTTPDAAIKAVAAGDRRNQLRDFSGAVAAMTKAIAHTFGTVAGTARGMRLPGNREVIVWAATGTDGILRTLVASFPAGQPGPLNDVVTYLDFLP